MKEWRVKNRLYGSWILGGWTMDIKSMVIYIWIHMCNDSNGIKKTMELSTITNQRIGRLDITFNKRNTWLKNS